MFLHICIYVYTYTCICIYVHTYMCIYIYTSILSASIVSFRHPINLEVTTGLICVHKYLLLTLSPRPCHCQPPMVTTSTRVDYSPHPRRQLFSTPCLSFLETHTSKKREKPKKNPQRTLLQYHTLT